MFTTSEVHEGTKTWEQYYAQFDTVKPEIGETYVVQPNTWQQSTYVIIYINRDIAVGRRQNPFNETLTEYDLFRARGSRQGWRYSDPRPSYRLRNLNTIKD